MEEAFTSDLALARRVTSEDLRQLSVWGKLLDTLCYWVRAQL
jgi:hypothetical protein